MRRPAIATVAAAALAGCAPLAVPPDARATGVGGQVAAVVAVELRRASATRVEAVVTATVPRTRVTAARRGHRRPLRAASFRRPVARRRVAIPVDPRDRATVTVTVAPQTP